MSTPPILSDRYELGETLGFGGMSEVQYARDLLLHRDVAVKVLRADLARDPMFDLRFRREAKNAAKLNHPSIVQVFDTGEMDTPDGPIPFIVMEYVDGETLRDVLREQGRVSQRQALTWMADVAAAMDFSHNAGIVHRDMKPANVMLDHTGAIKVMDFGIARAMGENHATMTQTSAVMGTAQYLSPEQARGLKVDPRSDIYSMGCVLFELATGEPPFTGDSPIAVAHQHVHEDPPRPSEINENLTPEFDSVVLKAMNKNPANRYQSAAEFRSDMIKLLAGKKPSAPVLLSDEERTELLGSSQTVVQLETLRSGKQRRSSVEPDFNDADDDEITPNRRRPILLSAVALVSIVVLALSLWAWAPWSSSNTDRVRVPDVASIPQDKAEAFLRSAGLEIAEVRHEPSTTAEGTALRTDPSAEVTLDRGTAVILFVSSGPVKAAVPCVRGMSEEKARAELAKVGFLEIRRQNADSTEADKDKVTRTNPAAACPAPGEEPEQNEIPVTTSITIYVGTGPKQVTIPDLKGKTEDEARETLDDLGLEILVEQVDSDQPAGQIIDTVPGPGATATGGDTVTVRVSRGNQITMPSVTRMTVAEARRVLRDAGWEGTLNETERGVGLGSADDGRILSQQPAAGRKVGKNDAVTVEVGKPSLIPR